MFLDARRKFEKKMRMLNNVFDELGGQMEHVPMR